MAESSRSRSSSSSRTTATNSDESSSSPITILAQDHLFSILLLLPIESILCFAMTCRKLKFLAYSDSLWESVCRRDWGNFPVDALKASNSVQGIHWKKLYQQVHQLDSVYCHKLLVETPDGDEVLPSPRASHSLNFVNGCLVLFGGGCEGGDTWVLDLSENLCFGTWQEIVTHPFPPSRSGHTLTHIGGTQTILFGGRGSGYEVLNDVWLLSASEGHWRWIQQLFDVGNVPQGFSLARVGHSANFILGGRLLIYGGEDTDRHRKDDFWVLDISLMPSIKMRPSNLQSKGLLRKMWRRLESMGEKPNCRSFHRACVDPSGRYLYVFGGMVDGLLQPSEPSGLRFDGGIFLVELVLQS
ncbi:F-box kelch-repeat At1g51550 [Olea europaea subsp. europaea]|uniref:F-box kelch-repeat At1g51550 n=1 Tax=Olea europaea subsp. europaea TaxID=158383 RepID=A0A8S0R2D1_OLEEU|nr:F-box kelch-repeat At1g51550 [Olea europaea subsp. europaea]